MRFVSIESGIIRMGCMKLSRIILTGLLLVSGIASAEYSHDQAMTVAPLNGIDIAYTSVGDVSSPPVLLIMGLTASHRKWPEDSIHGLVAAGYRVILFDNRDTGESSRLDALGEPTLWWQIFKSAIGLKVNAPYSLNDMAADGIAVLDRLGIEKAHIVGASMGGMIAQIIAAEYPHRATSLVSIMSSTGAPHLLRPKRQVRRDDWSLEQLHAAGIYRKAVPRQMTAVIAAGDRSEQVRTISVPTLVLHGEDDTLFDPVHGLHTHELITGSAYIVYAGMAHNIPTALVSPIVNAMTDHFSAAINVENKVNSTYSSLSSQP